MFGYINVDKEELGSGDKALYQSYYCGLCRMLKDISGIKGQMLLNYDLTFLVLLWSGLYAPESVSEFFKCALHPLKKKISIINSLTRTAAEMDIVLSYHSLIDDYEDDHSRVKLALAKSLEKEYQRIKQLHGKKVRAVEDFIHKTKEAELKGETNLDLVAGYMGQMMSTLFVLRDDEYKQDLADMGFYMGKFIYVMDAYEDLYKDKKSGKYNPLIQKKYECGKGFETYCKSTLTSLMSECIKSFERLPISKNEEILKNILYLGVWTKYDMVSIRADRIRKVDEEEEKKRVKKENAKDDKLIKSIEKKERMLAKKKQRIEKRKIRRKKDSL